MKVRSFLALGLAFVVGLAVGRGSGPSAVAEQAAPAAKFGDMLHVGVVVKDLDRAVALWKALGFADVRLGTPGKGIDRSYRGKPVDVTLKTAFVEGTRPMLEIMEPVSDAPNAWSEFLKEHGGGLHHLAYRVPGKPMDAQALAALGLEVVGAGKWPDGPSHWNSYQYVRDKDSGIIFELVARVPRG